MTNRTIHHVTHRSAASVRQQVLRFSDGDYARMTQSRLASPWGNEVYGMAACFEGERCIGTTSYTISPHRLGILSQVYTDADYRGQGVGRKTVNAALQAFRLHRTRAVYLGSAKEWVQRIYQSFGFEFVGAMGVRHAFKLALDATGSDDLLFQLGQPVSLRPWAVHDQADLCALFNAKHGTLVKHYQQGCYLGSHFEGEFYQLRNCERECPGFRAFVLEAEQCLVGMATCVPSTRRHEEHQGIVDVLVHPNYADQAPALICALHEQNELTSMVAYAGERDYQRIRALETAGYQLAGQLTGHLRIAAQEYDLLIYQRQQERT